MNKFPVPVSVLDLSPVAEGSTVRQALKNSVELARHAESLGYHRYWVAEHHSMPGIASAATSIVIGQAAAATSTIRVGSGGIMLSNHAPLLIAEQFGTLAEMFPGRVDLGLGRAPGSDRATMRALRHRNTSDDDFPEQLQELRFFLKEAQPGQSVVAVPGAGTDVKIWLLGSSDFSARLAGQLGLPFAFAAHFSPENTLPALRLYRENFRAVDELSVPHAMVAINVFAAETDAAAQKLATSQHQSFLNLIRGTPGRIQPPVDDMDTIWSEQEKLLVGSRLGGSIIGGPASISAGIEKLLAGTAADELIVNTMTFDHQQRLRSYEILTSVMVQMASRASGEAAASARHQA